MRQSAVRLLTMTPGPRMKPRVWQREKSAMCVVRSESSVAAVT